MGDGFRFPVEGPEVVVELPRGGFVKRRADGAIDFVSPLPCPYNYGRVPGLEGGDGDPLDALIVGPRLPRGARVRVPARALVAFVDGGARDDKLVVCARPLSPAELRGLERFFRAYALFKRGLARARRQPGPTRFEGLRPLLP